MKILQWLFTKEERTFLPEMLSTICFSIGISWVVCSYMLNQRDLLWGDTVIQAQDVDFEMYDTIHELTMWVVDLQIELLELQMHVDELENPWQFELDEPIMLPGLSIKVEERTHEVRGECCNP